MNVRIFKVDWYSGKPIVTGGGYQLAYQGDDMSNMVVFDKAPNLDNYYLVVMMKLDEADSEPTTLPAIQLEGPYWVVPNYYTQIAQTITFQCCSRTPRGDYEHHSAWFSGTILPSIKHNGDPIDLSPMFDPYMAILDDKVTKLIIAAGDVQIDSEMSDSSTNPVQNNVITGALAKLDDRVEVLEEGGSGGSVKGVGIETLMSLTQSEYDSIQSKDPATLYIITDEGSGGGGGGLPTYRVTNTLTHISTTNNATSVLYGNTYSATLIPDENYFIDSVRITMGGVDVTSSAYSNGMISIPSVTGNIAITAVGDTSLVSLPYLESDGSAYIVTDFVPNKTGLIYEAKLKNIDTSANKYYFGAFKFGSEQLGACGYGGGWVNTVHDGVGADFKIGATNVVHTIKRTPTALYCDNFDTPVKTVSAGSAISTNPFSVFAKRDGTNVTGYRLYYIKIYDTDGTTLLHEYVPAEQNSAACLYDSVTSKYFYNRGAGALTYGTELMA